MKPLQIVAGLLFIGAVLLFVGVFSKSWLSINAGSSFHANMGLREAEACMDDEPCKTSSLEQGGERERKTREVVMVWAGKFSFGLGIATALAALCVGIMFVSSGRSRGGFVVLGLGIASIAAAITFLVAIPDFGELKPSYGLGAFTFFGGAIVVVGASIWSMTIKDVIAPRAAAPAGPGPAVPACTQCGAPTVWVGQYQRYFCERCRVYV